MRRKYRWLHHWDWTVPLSIALNAVTGALLTLVLLGEFTIARRLLLAVVGLILMGTAIRANTRRGRTRTGVTIPVRESSCCDGERGEPVPVTVVEVNDDDNDPE